MSHCMTWVYDFDLSQKNHLGFSLGDVKKRHLSLENHLNPSCEILTQLGLYFGLVWKEFGFGFMLYFDFSLGFGWMRYDLGLG